MPSVRYHIVTLGCAKNVADSEQIVRALGEGAHVAVVMHDPHAGIMPKCIDEVDRDASR